ncbi:protein argonaute PNH1-like [Mercurialis annua]|uniref:protein argonaute PNH1-like n=1 Tax=Mercurialis annua TaxID=3986 RepID=UPI00215F7000|nr:protein argonaute PNH1-like [Mercurialis annua]
MYYRKKDFRVTIKFEAVASMIQLRDFLSGKPVNTAQEAITVIDIVLREFCSSKICLNWIGRTFYSPDIRKPQRLKEGLESWRGFYQSIRPTQMVLSLNIGTEIP